MVAWSRLTGDEPVLVLHNHGLLAARRAVPGAFRLIRHLEEACRLQFDIPATAAALVMPKPHVQRQVVAYFRRSERIPGRREWPELLRLPDRPG